MEITAFRGGIFHPLPGFIVNMKNGQLVSDKQSLDESHYLNASKDIWEIYSVKRLSDGEVFTVGNKVSLDGKIMRKFKD